jgi:hypothetical protein
MALVTLRPNVTDTASLFTLVGAATALLAVTDNVDTSYLALVSANGSALAQFQFETTAIPAGAYIKSVAPRIRWQGTTNKPLQYKIYSATVASPWFANPYLSLAFPPAIFTTQAGGAARPVYAGVQNEIDDLLLVIKLTDANCNIKISELYIDVVYNVAPVVSAVTLNFAAVTARPFIKWTFTDTELDAQDSYQVKVFSAAQYGAGGFDPETSAAAWAIGPVNSTALQVSVDENLEPGTTYKAYVKCSDVGSNNRYSSWASSAANTITVTLPLVPLMTAVTSVPASARIDVTVTAAASGAVVQSFMLQRSYDNGASWESVPTATALPITLGQAVVFADYTVRPNSQVIYRARVSGVSPDVILLTSSWSAVSAAANLAVTAFWLKNPVASSQNMLVHLVGDLDTENEETQGLFKPLGRDRAVVVSGDIYGETFDMTLAFYSEADWLAFEVLRNARTTLLLQSDMTWQWWLRLGPSRRARLVRRVDRRIAPYRQIQIAVIEVDSV